MPVLSICINTRNRVDFLIATLNSMIEQIGEAKEIEVVVVDGGSSDETPNVMRNYAAEYDYIRYVQCEDGLGIDDGYDKSVEQAFGAYCWLMTDDDLLMPGAINKIIKAIEHNHELIILNLNCYTRDLTIDLKQQLFPYSEDRLYTQTQFGKFLIDFGLGLSYIGCIVIRRELWFEHDRSTYYGSYFVHVGVLCTSSNINSIYYLNEPLILYRSANSSWTARSFEIWYFKWPQLIWSFKNISIDVRNSVVPQAPWNRALSLVKSRAMGEYDLSIFNKFLAKKGSIVQRLRNRIIAILPQALLSLSLIVFCLMFRRSGLYTLYNMMMSSPWPGLSRRVIRMFGIAFP